MFFWTIVDLICHWSQTANSFSRRTDDVDFDLSRDRRDVVLQLQGVDAFVWADARRDDQFCERGSGRQGDPLISGGQLLLSESPFGDGGRVSGDGDSDGERLRDDYLQAIFETTQVKGWTDWRGERGMKGAKIKCI